MNPLYYFFAAYLVGWLFIGGYFWTLSKRQEELFETLKKLKNSQSKE